LDPQRGQQIHDIRTLLAAIRDQAQLLRSRTADAGTDWAALAECLQYIEEAATHLGRLIDAIADSPMSRAGSSAGLVRSPTDLIQFARAVETTSDASDHGPLTTCLAGGERPFSQLPEVLPVSSVVEADSVVRAVQAGAMRYLLSQSNVPEWWQAIKAAVLGQEQLSREPAARLACEVLHREQLSQRELDVLRLLARGRANKRIAHDLTIAENTVKTHVSSILGKLGVESRTQAALYAGRIGLVPPDGPETTTPAA
jgi:DNA-binding CsgD family transcriptional regulator